MVEDEVINYAHEIGAGMIVVGSHHRSGLARLLSGETSVRILHEAQIPILVIPTIESK
ncbi:universal stress protein [Niabella ginsengisoli]|uniref:universal stress protein n=1 Tax=Niabella ginsengisoli TaxID=522298 RepID=UPI0021D47890|nr:universal stress protein [Niabella ginsengisoli]